MKKLLRNLLIGIGASSIVAGGALAAVLTVNSNKQVKTASSEMQNFDSSNINFTDTNTNNAEATTNVEGTTNSNSNTNINVDSNSINSNSNATNNNINVGGTTINNDSTTTDNNSTNNVGSTSQNDNAIANARLFSVATSYDATLDSTENNQTSGSTNISKLPGSISTSVEEGWKRVKVQDKKTGKITEDWRYQYADYYNDRNFMPIITDSDSIYPNERNSNLSAGKYPGWNRSNLVGYNADGIESSSNKALIYSTYTLNPELNSYFPSAQREIKSLWVDCYKLGSVVDASTINNYLASAVSNGVEFVTIANASQQLFEKIVVPNGIKKLTVLDSNNSLKSVRGITISPSVVELELYTKAPAIDPLILSDSTHVVFDHAIVGNYEYASAQFIEIDLSLHTNLTNDELQEAINIVYGKRAKERSFQGKISGGYISCLDITNTPIKTLNNVYIPVQDDGRFTISNVQWTSTVKPTGEVIVTIELPNGSNNNNVNISNDDKVTDWHDPSGTTQNVNKITINSNSHVTMEQAKSETITQIKKYPYAVLVDLSGIQLLDGNLSDLVAQVKEALGINDEEGRQITFNIEK